MTNENTQESPSILKETIMAMTGERLRDCLERSGLTQAEAARRAGLQRDAFGRYLLGKTFTPARKLIAIARVFGVQPSQLDPSRPDLDYASEAEQPQAYTITPDRDGLVRLDFSAVVTIEMAMEIVKVFNGTAETD